MQNFPSCAPDVIEEYVRFNEFVREVILPEVPNGFVDLSEFHDYLIFTACLPRSATAAPRGVLKSTILARYRALHRLVDPKSRPILGDTTEVAIVSETEKLAQDHLFWIKDQIQSNPILLHRYGNLVDKDNLSWNESDIRLTNGRRCIALGYGSQLRGRHPTDLIVDDLESLKNMGTEETLSKLKDWFFRVLYFASIPETHMTIIGTIVTPTSLLSELLDSEEWVGRTWEALQGEDTEESPYASIWPTRWSVPYLLSVRNSVGTHRFNAELQNRPLASSDPIIFPEWIRRHTEADLTNLPIVRRYLAVDPAFTTERWGCNSGIIILDETVDGRLFERLAWKKKISGPELTRTILSFYYHFSSTGIPVRLGVEEVQAQKMIRQSINELDPAIEVIPLKPDKDKARRLIDVSRYFEMGVVSLKTASLIDELLSFPAGEKDRVDALVWALKLYEREHPVINDSSYTELDPLKHMDEDARTWYMEKFSQGLPNYTPPSNWKRLVVEAQRISFMIDQEF